MKSLHFDLLNLTPRHNGEGSYSTQACRARGLQQLADELHALGYKLQAAKHLKPRHVEALVASWKANRLSDGTIRNRLAWARWWLRHVDKSRAIAASNEGYGLQRRERFKGNRARRLDADALARLNDERVALALKLEAAFGLRREEALKMFPRMADRGNRLILQASWTKGGRYREIPIVHPKQRALLEEIKALCGDGSLIGDGRNYKRALKHYEYTTLKAGLRNCHAYRHAYAQWRYKALTGWACPAAGGPTRGEMTAAQWETDRRVRLEISHELGHGRIDVTDTYLGRAIPARVQESRAA